MKYQIFILSFILFMVVDAASQAPAPTPKSNQEEINRRMSRETDARFRDLQDLDVPRVKQSPIDQAISSGITEIYRKPTKEETEILLPPQNLVGQYSRFLRQPKTGILVLNADERCAKNAEVVTAVENCLNYKIPGGGTSYSFRFESYRIPRLADIILEKNVLKTDGVWQQGIMTNLGDVPIEDITLRSDSLRYLTEFKPAVETSELKKIDQELSTGISSNGFVYRLGFYATNKTTYVFRSIAYKGTLVRSQNGIAYDEFKFDKRKDVVIVFRVVDVASNGNITLIWKELARRDSPTLKNSK